MSGRKLVGAMSLWREKTGALVRLSDKSLHCDAERKHTGKLGVVTGVCDNPFYALVLVEGGLLSVFEDDLEEVWHDQR